MIDIQPLQTRIDNGCIPLEDLCAQSRAWRELGAHHAQVFSESLTNASNFEDLLRGRQAIFDARNFGIDARQRRLRLFNRSRDVSLLLMQGGRCLGVIL